MGVVLVDVVSVFAEWLDRLTPLLSVVFAGITWIAGFVQHKVLLHFRQNQLNKLLGLKADTDCEVIVPIRYGKLRQRLNENEEYEMTISYDYITVDECLAVNEISRLLGSSNLCIVQRMEDMNVENNKICLGSILSNSYTIDFFHGNTGVHLLGRFVRASGAATLEHKSMQGALDLLVKRQEKHALFFHSAVEGEPVIEYPYDPTGDYVVWVKVRSQDYQQKQHGTVHFIFGDKSNTATNAIRFIATHREELYKILKKNKHLDHHFVVMRCSSTYEFDISSLQDVTDRMLKKS